MKLERQRFIATALVLAAVLSPAALAAENERPGEFGILGGFGVVDENLVGPGKDDNPAPVLGLRLGHRISTHINWYLDYTFGNYETSATPFSVDVSAARTGLEFLFAPERSWQWFLQLGAGSMNFSQTGATSLDRGFYSLGFGQRHVLDRGFFRWEIRGDQTVGDRGLSGETVTNLQTLFGYSWGFGGPPPDSDGDGVPDKKDDCPDTPRGARVDARGCPSDSDGDGVFDGIDQCPDTPKGAEVDARGCPLDSDGDGVFDGIDRCDGTPKGATVDARGCPSDSDGDGVFDGIDQCPDTPKGAKVDARGCPLDSDGDGVYDGIDQCPGTPKGTRVDARGCPVEEKPKPLFEGEKKQLVLEGVNFEFDSDKLTPASRAILDRVSASLVAYPEVRVEVGGHTDSVGNDAYNQKLSRRRAQAVVDHLAGKGVATGRLVANGYGEARPIGDNATETGRARNRRVELKKLN